MSDGDFWASSYKRINYMIMKFAEEKGIDTPAKTQPQAKTITSMKEINGWC